MALFIARVELHDAKREDYDVLHSEMGKEGFKRTITSDDGTIYNLPWGVYSINSDLTTTRIREKAAAAADRTNKTREVLITKSDGCSWTGLSTA